jgi:hypothetical protein
MWTSSKSKINILFAFEVLTTVTAKSWVIKAVKSSSSEERASSSSGSVGDPS